MSLLTGKAALGGGLNRHVRQVAKALAARTDESYVFFAPAAQLQGWRGELPDGTELVSCTVSSDSSSLRAAFENLVLPLMARAQGCEAVFYPQLAAPLASHPVSVVTIHDMQPISQPNSNAWHKRLYHRVVYDRVSKGGFPIVTDSEASRREICELLAIGPERVRSIALAADEEFFAPPGVPPRQFQPRGPYVLSVGASYPHKRLPLLVTAFAQLARSVPDLELAFAGTHIGPADERDRLLAAIRESPVRDRVHVLPPLPWNELPALYTGAAALVVASAYEGFCLPVAEAMAAGVPVASSPCAAAVETLAGHGEVAAGWDAAQLADAAERVLGWTAAERASRCDAGTAYARRVYRWSRVAADLAEIFVEAAGSRRVRR